MKLFVTSLLAALLAVPAVSSFAAGEAAPAHDAAPAAKMPRVSHEALAEMVGTTRSRVTHFMNKFRTLGLIDYNGDITVRAELLTDVVLHD